MTRDASRPSLAERAYGFLLLAYPPGLRTRFGAGMRDAFRHDVAQARARGTAAALWFCLRTAAQVIRFGLAERGSLRSALTFDWRDAFRSLRATPIVSAIAVVSLALGIGANTALFSILNSLMLKTLPVRDPAALVRLDSDYTNPIWEQIRDHRSEWFDGALAWSAQRFNLSDRGETDPAEGAYASGGFFDVLGVRAKIGRTFTDADDVRGGGPDGPVAVIGYGFWQRRFGGTPDVLGRRLLVERVPMTIIGVLPKEFFGPEVGRTLEVIVPIGHESLIRGRTSQLDSRLTWWLSIVARLKPGQTPDGAAAALNTALPAIRAATMPPQLVKSGAGDYLAEPFVLVPAANGESQLRTRYQQPLTVILVVVGAVLLIACANIANLLLARTAARRRELSLRLALGASRARLARQLVAESLLLSGTGAAIGLLLAVWGSGLLVRAIATRAVPASMDLSIDWRVLAFTAGTAIAAALLFGLAPAVGIANVGPQEALKEQGRGVVGDRHAAARNALVVVQVALSLGLVVVAGLFARTFAALTAVPLGFDSQSMLTAHIDLKQSAAGEAGRADLYEQLRAAAASVPGVTSLSASTITPVSGSGWNTLIERPVPENSTQKQRMSWVNAISPEWFDTYRMHLLAGRVFATQDRPGAPRVMIVNQAFVRQFLAGVNPIGQEIQTAAASESRTYEIVGVVNDAVYRSQRTGIAPTLYLPLAQTEHRPPDVMLTARLAGVPAGAVTQAVIEAVGHVDPRATVTFSLIDDQVRATVTRERVVAALASFFGGLALLLAGLGLYGVTAYSVGRRRAEIGIRMALGADPGGVVRLVLRRLAWLMAAGVALGAVLSFWVSSSIQTLLFGVTARDPLTFVAAGAVLACAGGMAGWLPARRAARIDPLRALRDQ